MPDISEYSTETWAEVEKAAIAGVTWAELSNKFSIPETNLRKRASRYKWAVPTRIKELKEQLGNGASVTNRHKASQIAAETLQERAEAYSLTVFDYASKSVQQALKQGLPTPDNWKTADVADRMARRAAGLDKPQTVVAVQLGSFFRPTEQQESCVILESEKVEDADSCDDPDSPDGLSTAQGDT